MINIKLGNRSSVLTFLWWFQWFFTVMEWGWVGGGGGGGCRNSVWASSLHTSLFLLVPTVVTTSPWYLSSLIISCNMLHNCVLFSQFRFYPLRTRTSCCFLSSPLYICPVFHQPRFNHHFVPVSTSLIPQKPTLVTYLKIYSRQLSLNEINLTWLDFLCRYLRCCPACRSLRRTRESFKSIVFYNLQNLSSFFKRKSPRLVMFGPGLESDTKGLVRQLLWDSTSPFEVTGMFPGQFDGIYRLFFICISNPERKIL